MYNNATDQKDRAYIVRNDLEMYRPPLFTSATEVLSPEEKTVRKVFAPAMNYIEKWESLLSRSETISNAKGTPLTL